MGVAIPSTRALDRDAWISMSETQAVNFRLPWNQPGQNATETQCIFAECRSHPVVAGGCQVTFVEDEVNNLEHRRQSGCELGLARYLERDVGLGQGWLGPNNSLANSGLWGEKFAGNFLGRQASKQAQCEGNARFAGEHRMTGDEHQPQQVITYTVINGGIKVRYSSFPAGELAAEFFLLA